MINSNIKLFGHVTVWDKETREVLVDKPNSIHYENFSIALAKSLARDDDGYLYEMHFGNGGATVSGTGIITYLPPNTIGTTSQIYNKTFSKVINDNLPTDLDPAKNYIDVLHIPNQTYTDLKIFVTLDFGEPGDQAAFDNVTSTESIYTFDELGLVSAPIAGSETPGLLLSHVIFHPVQKSLNRVIEILYTIRLAVT